MARPRSEQAHNTKEEILEKAAQLFALRGYEATSMSMIAKEVGVTKSAIYAHYKGKEEIIKVIVDRYGPPRVVNFVEEIDYNEVTNNPEAAFLAIMERFINFFIDKKSRLFIDLLRMGCTSLGKGDVHSLHDTIAHAKEVGGAFITRLQKDGIIKDEFPSDLLVWELMSPLIHARLMYFTSMASDKEIAMGKSISLRHIQYFIANNFVRKS